jgi:signal peptidase II
MHSKYRMLLIVSLVTIVLDQATKLYIARTLPLHAMIRVIENFFTITYLRNRGAAFGMLATSPWRLPFFLLVSTVAVVVIFMIIRKLRDDQKLSAFSLSLILAGAVGNLIDRVSYGEVIDFIFVHWYDHYWPAFNVADSAICVGVFLLSLDMIREERRVKQQQQSEQ